MKKIKGDIITEIYSGNYDLVFHGCNCFNKMGAGVAKVLADEFPMIRIADAAVESGRHKLGHATRCDITLPNGKTVIILNCYTQVYYGRGDKYFNYEALKIILKGIRERYSDKKILYPKIGAGLGGGDWELIESIIDSIFYGLDHTLVYL